MPTLAMPTSAITTDYASATPRPSDDGCPADRLDPRHLVNLVVGACGLFCLHAVLLIIFLPDLVRSAWASPRRSGWFGTREPLFPLLEDPDDFLPG